MKRIRIGVVGCGLVSQSMHLPHLEELHELYEVVALCDVSPGTLTYVADYYGIARRHADHRELLKERLDAVMVLSADSHGQIIVDALRAGKHVVTEKPMCFALSEADEILRAHKAAGTVCMVTYMKRYDPAYRYVEPLVRGLRDLQAIEITVLHPSEANQIGHHDIRRVPDVPAPCGSASGRTRTGSSGRPSASSRRSSAVSSPTTSCRPSSTTSTCCGGSPGIPPRSCSPTSGPPGRAC